MSIRPTSLAQIALAAGAIFSSPKLASAAYTGADVVAAHRGNGAARPSSPALKSLTTFLSTPASELTAQGWTRDRAKTEIAASLPTLTAEMVKGAFDHPFRTKIEYAVTAAPESAPEAEILAVQLAALTAPPVWPNLIDRHQRMIVEDIRRLSSLGHRVDEEVAAVAEAWGTSSGDEAAGGYQALRREILARPVTRRNGAAAQAAPSGLKATVSNGKARVLDLLSRLRR